MDITHKLPTPLDASLFLALYRMAVVDLPSSYVRRVVRDVDTRLYRALREVRYTMTALALLAGFFGYELWRGYKPSTWHRAKHRVRGRHRTGTVRLDYRPQRVSQEIMDRYLCRTSPIRHHAVNNAKPHYAY